MKKIVLDRLTFRNFKGFREHVMDTKGGDTDVFGDNGTGKTSLFDGFIWSLQGKDSQNKADFEIKELNAAGKVRNHKLDHEVEVVLLINGLRKTFRRVFAEQWTKKRGTVTSEFSGHTTTYYVDGVPVKLSEYKDEVDAVIQENLFKLLTSPTFFNEQLKKEERRKILLEVCGDITDAEVIHSSKLLERLPSILGDRTLEKHVATIKARRTEINKEIEKLPTRIDEANRSMPDIADLDEELLQEDIDTLRSRIKTKEDERSRIQNGGEIAVKEKRLREIEGELISIQNRLQSDVLDKVAIKRDVVGQMQSETDAVRRQIDDKQYRIKQNEQTIEARKQQATRLRVEWTEVNESVFVGREHDENCPTCRQALPQEQIHEAFQIAVASFNKSKSERLEQVSGKGRVVTEESRELEQNNNRLLNEINHLSDQLIIRQSALTKAETELTELRSGMQDPASDSDYKRLLKESLTIKQEIEQLRISAQSSISKVQNEIVGLQTDLRAIEEDQAKLAQVNKIQQRISVLEKEERELAIEYERLEEELFLTEEFTKTKVSLLDSKINSKFKYARFRLFEDQINGGLKEVCDTLFEGVPYGSGLNRAAQYNVGIDIINTLSDYYGFSAPIFIDNAEAVTKLIDTDAQLIRLIVSEKDKKLRIETKSNDIQEAI